MNYMGDYPTSHTKVVIPFDSFAAATGAPAATSNFAAGDVLIYKDGSNTQRTSSNGITVTTTFDSLTGLQLIVIDLSDNSDASFYAAGSEYTVAVSDVTIDGQTVRFWAGSFSIERAGGVLALLKAGTAKVDVTKWLTGTIPAVNVTGIPKVDVTHLLGTAWLTPGVAGTPDVNVEKWNGTAVPAEDTAGYPKVTIKDGTGTGELDTASGKVSIAANGLDAAAVAADAVTEIQSGLATAAAVATVDGKADAILADTAAIDARLPSDPADDSVIAAATGAILSAINALNDLSAAQVSSEIADALAVDTHAQPTGAPVATTTIVDMLGRLHQALRNGLTVSNTEKTFNDDAGAPLWKKALSDNGTTYTEGEAAAA